MLKIENKSLQLNHTLGQAQNIRMAIEQCDIRVTPLLPPTNKGLLAGVLI